MSNNRKRNMKKLARNIITGTALAVGGLTQTSAAETTNTEQSGGKGVTAMQITSVAAPLIASTAGIVLAAKQASESQKLTASGNTETARHNKWVEDEKVKEKERTDKLPMAQNDFDTLVGRISAQKGKMKGNPTVMKGKLGEALSANKPGVIGVADQARQDQWGPAVKNWMDNITADPEGKKLEQLVDGYINYVNGNQANLVKGCVVLCTQRTQANKGQEGDVYNAMNGNETVVGGNHAEVYQVEAGTERPGKELRDVWNAFLGENMKMLLGDCVAPKLMVPWRWGHSGGGAAGRDFGLINAANNDAAAWANTTVDGAAKAIANWGKSENAAPGGGVVGETPTRKDFIEKTPAGLYLLTDVGSTKSANSNITTLNTSGGNQDHGYKLIFREGHASMGKTKPTKIKELREKLNALIWDTAGAANVRQDVDPNFDPNF